MAYQEFNPATDYKAGTYVWVRDWLYQFTHDHPAGRWTGGDAQLVSKKELINKLGMSVSELADLQDALEAELIFKRYGVTGIGQSAAALTRLYDAVGMTAEVGTDGDNSEVVNDFDSAAPFARRKCVGTWSVENGKAKFNVAAYLGDADYTEDGSMGDYVAVECPLCFYSYDGATLVISAHQYEGMRAFDIFTQDHDQEKLLDKYYLPAYALAMKDGQAVSLPGLQNDQGNYQHLLTDARTYGGGALGNLAILQPMAVNFYEWALFTVEFATQNCQTVMSGYSNIRSDGNDRLTFKDATHVLVQNFNAARIAGEQIAILATSVSDIHSGAYYATHKILSATRCNAQGEADASGTYELLEVEDLGKNYWTYDTTGATEYKLGGRAALTGSCVEVDTPSGSPNNNTNGYNPMQYRYRENVFGNQFKTTIDLFAVREGTGDSDYYLDYYYLPQPESYSPANTNKPDATDMKAEPFVKLGVQTDHDHYVNGYVKSKQHDEEYPDIWVPGETAGGSATTYFSDYASLVTSLAYRSVRVGGLWATGAADGFSFFYASNYPSNSSATFGGDLCFIQ